MFLSRNKELEISIYFSQNDQIDLPQCTLGSHWMLCTIQFAYILKDATKNTHFMLYDCSG